MKFSMLNLLAGRRHQFGALMLMRGETFLETIDEGGMAAFVLIRGSAAVSRQRVGAQAGLHLTPRLGEPVVLTNPGTYCVVAKEHVIGLRLLRMGDAP
ncbi:hypothetical protein OV079_02400 [Nannocystis pusilla]|uniref:Uncharacterized protein n=1 Tax=Nannocystis pusilla TaxID=889268 RepID=A0A9X3IUJ2_9BACT|nr:hypothetical protein [Nannocystis pusilla]MCY1004436.1 hypothetical protein [Nannocystis pusilla]